MCYDIKASLESQLSRARRNNDAVAIKEITKKLLPLTDLPIYHASGFSHPKLFIYTNNSPYLPHVAFWGLVPHWVKDKEQVKKIWNNTLNARCETLFEKPSFREAAKFHRCIVYVDGFYEHHHYKGKTYPFFIYKKNNLPLALAGLWSEWVYKETGEILTSFSIVTTKGNTMMSKIHNNPKLTEPRMPLLLTNDLEDKWLDPIMDKNSMAEIQQELKERSDDYLRAYTVNKLRGLSYLGNVEKVSEPREYPELIF